MNSNQPINVSVVIESSDVEGYPGMVKVPNPVGDNTFAYISKAIINDPTLELLLKEDAIALRHKGDNICAVFHFEPEWLRGR
jgi:hypothetical protein